ncbi:MAG TPA: SH3 domain-containing protein [Verrucomicrobiae bacterium]|nr:SH3 domain-containing protein [Verrucomicrobiae bacterium]
MKTISLTILAAMAAAGAVAQDTNNTLPAIPAPVTSPMAETSSAPAAVVAPSTPGTPPAAPHRRATRPRRVALVEPTVTLVPGPAEVAVANLNVRGQAGLKGEYIMRLTNGDTVTVLNEITLTKHVVGEPAQWAKIAFPATGHVWVSAKYIDATNGTVLPKKLNVRAGPGENYSVLGVVEGGTPVSQIATKDGWMEIEPPTNAYAFVAAMYLKQEASELAVANPPPSTETEISTTTNTVPEQPAIVTTPATTPETNELTTAETTSPETMEMNPPQIDTNLPPPVRIVSHEGVVRHVTSPIAPTEFELYNPATGVDVDFLYAPNVDLSHYVGMRIIVTGEEGLAQRWTDIPVLSVQQPGDKIVVLETNAIPTHVVQSPRGAQQQPH